jgi:hypothetical protein
LGLKLAVEQKIISEYLRRSYFALDGLWFMMLEEEFSFDRALEIDEKVWRILPKIQARKTKELLGLEGKGLQDFLQAIRVKLQAEEYDYEERELGSDHIQIAIHRCPWYEILKRVNREHLEPRIADAICSLEFRVWLEEFGEHLSFSISPRCYTSNSLCLLDFRSE